MSAPKLVLCSAFVVAALLALASACDEPSPAARCRNIPQGGCPAGPKNLCDDPTCLAAYGCNEDGTWTFQNACPARDAAPEDPSRPDRAAPSPLFDASIDAPPGAAGGPGCRELEAPDCPLARVLACTNGCCDCEELFVCENGGWSVWGVCGDGGVVPR